jgi:hypothetical protein
LTCGTSGVTTHATTMAATTGVYINDTAYTGAVTRG